MHFHVDHVIMLHSISLIPGSKLTSSTDPGLIWETAATTTAAATTTTTTAATTTAATTATTTTTTTTTAATATTNLTTPSYEPRDKDQLKVASFTVAVPFPLQRSRSHLNTSHSNATGSWWKADVQDTWGQKHHWSQSDLVDLVRENPTLWFSQEDVLDLPRAARKSLSTRRIKFVYYEFYVVWLKCCCWFVYCIHFWDGCWGSSEIQQLWLDLTVGFEGLTNHISFPTSACLGKMPVWKSYVTAQKGSYHGWSTTYVAETRPEKCCLWFLCDGKQGSGKTKVYRWRSVFPVTLRTDKGTELLVDNVRGLYLGLRLCYQRP